MLKYINKKVIDSFDWDKLVKETYNKPYCFQQQDGCKHRGTHYISIPCEYAEEFDEQMNENIPFKINGEIMGVKFQTWLNTTQEDINSNNPELYKNANKLFWERNFYPCIEILANDLYKKRLIEEGEYIIDIDW